MGDWIHQMLDSGHAGFAVLAAVFVMGMIGVLTCGCNYAVFAVVAGYSGAQPAGGKRKNTLWAGIAFLAGAVISMSLIGTVLGYAGGILARNIGNYWKIVSGLVCIFFGLYSMDLLPFRMPSIKVNTDNRKSGTGPAIIFGLTVGGLFSALNSCCNPLFPVILAASFVKGSTLWGLLLLSVFAIGYALPLTLVLIGVRLGLQALSEKISKAGAVLKYIGGSLLIILGFYFLLTI